MGRDLSLLSPTGMLISTFILCILSFVMHILTSVLPFFYFE